jgi:hypothetical protein
VKPLFGNLSARVNGNMFMGLVGSDIGPKLPPDERATLLTAPLLARSARRNDARGATSRSPATRSADEDAPWIANSPALLAALPPKKPRWRTIHDLEPEPMNGGRSSSPRFDS